MGSFGAWMLLLLIAGIGDLAGAQPEGHRRLFRAGAATGDITPDLGVLIIGGWNPVPAKHVHDPLQVRALALDDGGTRLAFVVCDNLGLPREVCDEARRLTEQQTGLAASHVLVAATHTHSGGSARTEIAPETGGTVSGQEATGNLDVYQRFIARRIADTVQCAINNLEPARIGWGAGSVPNQVFNRRWFVASEDNRRNPFGGVDVVRMNPPNASPDLIKPAGPVDPEVVFLSVQATGGRPIALLANYSLHYVGDVPDGTISADYFGCFAERIRDLLSADGRDPPFVGILTNGTSGDINNVDRRTARVPMAPYERMRMVAGSVATEVFRVYRTTQHRDWAPLGVRFLELPLAPRRPDQELVTWAREVLRRPAGMPGWHPRERNYAKRVLQMAQGPEVLELPLQAFGIGELGVVGIPAEAFVEIGLDLKERTPFAKTFTISIANGYFGYLPTVGQHRLGGYETWIGTNRLEVEAAPKITSALLRLLGDLRAAEPAHFDR